MTIRLSAAIAAAGLLAACSDGDGPGYDTMVGRYERLVADYNAHEFVDPTTIPVSGSASYMGQMWMETGAGGVNYPVQVIGNLAMTTRFDPTVQPITGSVTGLRDENNAAWDGRFTIADGFLDRTADVSGGDATWGADMSGTVRRDDGATATLIDTYIRGNFTDGGNFIGGGIAGEVLFQGSGRDVRNPIGLAGVVGERQ